MWFASTFKHPATYTKHFKSYAYLGILNLRYRWSLMPRASVANSPSFFLQF